MMQRMWVVAVALVGLLATISLSAAADEKKAPEKKSGTVMGELTAKAENWIEVKADGEEKARRYVPHWRGGLPKDGGGLDKDMLKVFKDLKVGSRIRITWEFEERARVVKIEVLKAPDKEKEK